MEIIKNHWNVKSLHEGNILRLIFKMINIEWGHWEGLRADWAALKPPRLTGRSPW